MGVGLCIELANCKWSTVIGMYVQHARQVVATC